MSLRLLHLVTQFIRLDSSVVQLPPPMKIESKNQTTERNPFEQNLSNKVHSDFVIPKRSVTKRDSLHLSQLIEKCPIDNALDKSSITQASGFALGINLGRDNLHQPAQAQNPALKSPIIKQKQEPDTLTSKEKKRILDQYQNTYGADYSSSIVTSKKGKQTHDINNCHNRRSRMKPSLDKWYRVEDLHLYNVITTVIKEA